MSDRIFRELVDEARAQLARGVRPARPHAERWEKIALRATSPSHAAEAWGLAAEFFDSGGRREDARRCAVEAAESWLKAGRPDQIDVLLSRVGPWFEPGARAVFRAKARLAEGKPEAALSELADYADEWVFELRSSINRDLGREDRCLEDLARAIGHRMRHGRNSERLLEKFNERAAEFQLESKKHLILARFLGELSVNDLRRRPRRGE